MQDRLRFQHSNLVQLHMGAVYFCGVRQGTQQTPQIHSSLAVLSNGRCFNTHHLVQYNHRGLHIRLFPRNWRAIHRFPQQMPPPHHHAQSDRHCGPQVAEWRSQIQIFLHW